MICILEWEGKILTGSNVNKTLYMKILVSTKHLINYKMKLFIQRKSELKIEI